MAEPSIKSGRLHYLDFEDGLHAGGDSELRLKNYRETVDRLKKEIHLLIDKTQKDQSELDTHKRRISEMEALRLSEAKAQERLTEEMTSERTRLSLERKMIENATQNLLRDLAKATKENSVDKESEKKWQVERTRLEEKISSLEAKVQGSNQQLKALHECLSQATRQAKEFELRFLTEKERLSASLDTLTEIDSEISRLRFDAKKNLLHIQELEEDLKEKDLLLKQQAGNRLNNESSVIESLNRSLAEEKEARAQEESQRLAAENQVSDLEEEKSRLLQSLNSKNNIILALQGEATELQNLIRESSEQKIAFLTQSLAEKTKETMNLAQNLATEASLRFELQSQLEAQTSELERRERKWFELQKSLEADLVAAMELAKVNKQSHESDLRVWQKTEAENVEEQRKLRWVIKELQLSVEKLGEDGSSKDSEIARITTLLGERGVELAETQLAMEAERKESAKLRMELESKIRSIEIESLRLQGFLESSNLECNRLKSDLIAQEDIRKNLISKSNDELRLLQSRLDEQTTSHRAELLQREELAIRLNAKVTQLELERSNLHAKIETLIAVHQAEAKEAEALHQSAVSKLEKSIASKEMELGKKVLEIQELVQKTASLEAELIKKLRHAEGLDATVGALQERLRDSEQDLKRVQSVGIEENRKLQSKLTEVNQILESYENKLSESAKALEGFKTKEQAMAALIRHEQQDKQRIEAERSKLTTELKALQLESVKLKQEGVSFRSIEQQVESLNRKQLRVKNYHKALDDKRSQLFEVGQFLINELSGLRTLSPIEEILRVTETELRASHQALLRAPALSPDRSRLEEACRQLEEQRALLVRFDKESRARLRDCENRLNQVFRSGRLSQFPPLP